MVLILYMAVLRFRIGDFPETSMTKRQMVPSRGKNKPCFARFPLSLT